MKWTNSKSVNHLNSHDKNEMCVDDKRGRCVSVVVCEWATRCRPRWRKARRWSPRVSHCGWANSCRAWTCRRSSGLTGCTLWVRCCCCCCSSSMRQRIRSNTNTLQPKKTSKVKHCCFIKSSKVKHSHFLFYSYCCVVALGKVNFCWNANVTIWSGAMPKC